MSTVIGAMEAYLKLNIDDFEKNLQAARKQVESISSGFDVLTAVGDKISGVGNKLTLGLTTPVIGLGTACVKATSDFDSIMSKVSAVSGVTGDSLQQLRDKAKEMGAVTKFSAVEAGEAFTYMAMAGWDAEQMMAGISGIMDLAAADGLDLATTSDIVTDALTAFGLKASDAGHFADVLAKASSSANTNVSMLGESFKYVAPVAGAMGYSVEDVGIALGLMANSGIKAGQAGTAMRAALTRMAKPTKDAAALMDKYDLSISNSDGSMKSLREVMIMLRENMGDLTEAEQIQAATMIFGQEAMSGMLAIINSSDADFNKLTNSIDNANGTAKEMADTLMNNLGGEVEELKGALETLAISFGELIIPVVRKAVAGLQKLVDGLNAMDDSTKKAVITAAAVVASIGPVLSIVGKTISIVGTLGSTISNMKAILVAVNGSLAATGTSLAAVAAPILAVVAVIAILVAAFKHLWDTNEEFRNAMTSIWQGIVTKFNEFCQGIVDRLNELGFDFENIVEVLKAVWDGFCSILAPYFEAVFAQISNILSLALDVLLNIFDIFIGIFTGDWSRAWEGVKGIFVSVWEFLKNFFNIVTNALRQLADTFLGWFGTSWEEVWGSIKQFFVDTWNSIKDFFNGITAWFTNAWNSLATFFTNLWNSVSNFFINLWNGITTTVQGIVSGFVNFINTHFNGMSASLSGILEGVKNIFSNIWTVIKNVVGGIVLALCNLVTLDFNKMKSDISTVMTNIQTAFSNIWNSIKSVITNVVTAIQSFLSGAWSAISSVVSTAWNGIKNAISTAANAIRSAVTSAFEALKTSVTNIFNSIKTAVTNAANSAKTAAVNAFNAMRTGVSNAITNVKNAIVNGLNSAISFIKALPGQAVTWGKDMIQGFTRGVKNAMTNLINSVKGLAEKVRSYLHFSRPDVGPLRDYETWMPDMVAGLSKTLESASPGLIDRIRQLSSNMTDALNGGNYQVAVAGIGADIRAGGNSMNRNDYSSLNKSSEPQVVEKTEIHIEKIEVRDDHDLEMVTQGLYNKQDQNLRALGRRNM